MKPPSLQGLGGVGLAPTPHALQKALLRALSSLFVPFPIQAHCSAFSSLFFSLPSCCSSDVHTHSCTRRLLHGTCTCASGWRGAHPWVPLQQHLVPTPRAGSGKAPLCRETTSPSPRLLSTSLGAPSCTPHSMPGRAEQPENAEQKGELQPAEYAICSVISLLCF